ncbi:MAG: hypothetical protein ACXWFZ_09155 [Nitrososphaeraceae archaeon]
MGRTIPSFRIATVLEEEKWKLFRKYLKNKKDKKLFNEMFSVARLYNSACSNAVNPIRIFPILMSIIFHHYKKILSKSVIGFDNNSSSSARDYDINDYNNNSTTILKQELDKWYNFSFVLRKQNRELFDRMIQLSSYKYSLSINAKGKEFSTESLLISLIFDQHKMMLPNSFFNNKIDCYL